MALRIGLLRVPLMPWHATLFHRIMSFHSLSSQDPARKIQTHHYASRLNEDVLQCVVFDSPEPNARLIGELPGRSRWNPLDTIQTGLGSHPYESSRITLSYGLPVKAPLESIR